MKKYSIYQKIAVGAVAALLLLAAGCEEEAEPVVSENSR